MIQSIESEEKKERKLLGSIKGLRVTRQNFGWWSIFFLIVVLIIGVILARFSSDPNASFFEPIIWFMDLFLYKSGLSLESLDNRTPIILRGLAKGTTLTFTISLVSVGLGFLLGAILAVLLVSKGNVYGLKKVAQAYVDFFRSTPLLVQILLIYFGIAGLTPNLPSTVESLGIYYSTFAGTIALSLNTAAYQAEIIRGGILAIPTGQTEAARALGLTSGQTMRYVILPQTIRMVVPPLTNEIINVLLNSSLISSIGVLELTKRSQSLQSYYFLWQVFFMAAVFYFVIAFTLSKITKRLEIKFRIPGLGVAND
ncbi:MAG: amino acid ABC transporter permease [Promethearchaeota archaeon]